ncbi:MAG TPA: heterodisulfide reductase-related iron-sulfur binding cluster [Thermoleophilaceae bacterium]
MPGAYDDTRAPQLDLIDDCVHCGFCLPTCPTYNLWGEEMDSPRGRIVLIKAGHEEGATLAGPVTEHLDRCLGCMACVTACPSGVRYDMLIEDARAQVERNVERPATERAYRRLIFELFTHPARLRASAPGAALARRLGLDRLARRPRLRELSPRLSTLLTLTPDAPLKRAFRRLPEHFEASGERRGTVALMQGCVQRVFFGHVNEATAGVLAAEGFEVHVPRLPRCCGALQLHSGEDAEARALAKATIEAFERYEHVVVNAAGCGSAMKDYGHVLGDEPDWAERAKRFSERVVDANEFLAALEPRAERKPLDASALLGAQTAPNANGAFAAAPGDGAAEGPLRVAYHDACHLAHAQGIRAQPRELLRAIPGLELVEPAEWELCCGSAGVYNLLQPEPAGELGERKARNLLDTGAQVVVAANPGCALQITTHSGRLGRPLPVMHPMELLWRSIA